MKGIILYQSKYGATKKYADWIIIVLGGGIYAMGIAGLSFLKRNIDVLSDKKIIVFFCCASPYDEDAHKQIRSHNMKDKLSDIPIFYCRGAWDMDSMSFKDKTLCKMLRKAVSKKDPADYEIWEKAIMDAGENKCDWTDKKYIDPILKCI